jgi:hypothetical protein
VSYSEMRILTLRQPWAHAVAHLGKTVENRPWKPGKGWRGTLAIHAGRSVDTAARAVVEEIAGESLPHRLIGGIVVAVAELVDVHSPADCWVLGQGGCSPWAESGAFHWVLEDVRPLRSGPETVGFGMQGALGLRRVSVDEAAEILARVA